LAGLTCAFALKQRAIASTIFEMSAEIGGRCPAASYLLGPDVYTNTFRLASLLGLDRDLIEIPPIAGQFYKGRIYHHRVSSVTGLLGFKGLNIADKALLSRMVYFLLRHSSKLDLQHPEKGIALDNETTAAFAKRELSQNILNYVAGPLISSLFYYGSEETSRLLYLNLAKYMQNIRMFAIRGGTSRLAKQLRCGAGSVRNERVGFVSWQPDGYVVNGQTFSGLVVAVAGTDVLRIEGMKSLLGPEDRRFFEDCRYGRAVAVTVETDHEIDRCYALSIPRVEGKQASTIVHHAFIDPSEAAEERRRVSVIGGGDAVTAENLLQELVEIYNVNPRDFVVREWIHAMPKFPPGRFRDIASFVSRQRRPGLYFCGDYLMGPFIEAAIMTGFAASQAVGL